MFRLRFHSRGRFGPVERGKRCFMGTYAFFKMGACCDTLVWVAGGVTLSPK